MKNSADAAVRLRAPLLSALALSLCACGGGEYDSPHAGLYAPNVYLAATPSSVLLGESTTLTVGSNFGNAFTCTATGAWSGSGLVGGSSSVQTPAAVGTTTYGLTCNASGTVYTASLAVSVGAQPSGLRMTTPAGFKLDASHTAANQPLQFTTSDGRYLKGGDIFWGNAEIIQTSETAPPPPLANYVAVEIKEGGGTLGSLAATTVDGVSCTRASSTFPQLSFVMKTVGVYCPVGTKLFKFYLTYYSTTSSEAQYLTAFQGMLDAVDFN